MVKRFMMALLLLMLFAFPFRYDLLQQPFTKEASVHAVALRETAPAYASTTSSPKPKTPTSAGKTVFLTFDDGPSALTGKVLDILKKNNIRATFFVLGEQVKRYPELLQRIYDEGHAIGNHSYDHNYTELYSGFPAFWSQIKRTEAEVYGITGVRPQLVRAPGGTAGHFDDTYFRLMKLGGYVVTDWNVDSGDSKRRGVPAAEIVKGAETPVKSDRVVLLMHDGGGHDESVKALPQIIAYYKNKGYQFGVLSPDEDPVQFKVNDKARKLQRGAPSEAWVQSHVAGNSALFAGGKPLRLEVGPMETTLNPGEYLYEDGHYLVPARAVAERLGGTAVWEAKTQTAKVTLSAESVTALHFQIRTGLLTITEAGKNVSSVSTSVRMINDAVWVPVRDLFANAGYKRVTASETGEERRIKVM
ncbi:polysaccharide deacetylase family protein [Paenibacillus sp. VCA1]|uniref:polysaccharide deacetylase n=1 Tax=Paenibacillus sp. VCA1 TaxID=3039148 RepID=UPI002871DBDA|nr:polysaccharide deacetylase family protein [Paenibacillus sp. VCA1]MDR9852634.1 polysaccharide deacetylase family protein [Paenibacillus sp. VCA1]